MSGQDNGARRWAEAAKAAVVELASVSLGLSEAAVLGSEAGLPENMTGALVPLVGPQESLDVGLFADAEGCGRLSASMLGMEPEDQDMVVDAMCELSNVLAGLVKRKLLEGPDNFEIGLPVYIRGALAVAEGVESATMHVKLGTVDAKVVLFRHVKQAASEGSYAAASGAR